jgi:hypothetical protein
MSSMLTLPASSPSSSRPGLPGAAGLPSLSPLPAVQATTSARVAGAGGLKSNRVSGSANDKRSAVEKVGDAMRSTASE